MSIPMAAALAAGLVASLNLLLTFGVIRRLREHTKLLATRSEHAPAPQPGHAIGEFNTTSVDGVAVTREWVERQGVVAFLSPGCEACEEALAPLTDYVRGVGRALVVVEGEDTETRRIADAFDGLATVVTQRPAVADPVREAFGVKAFPIVMTVGDGAVTAVLEPAAYGHAR